MREEAVKSLSEGAENKHMDNYALNGCGMLVKFLIGLEKGLKEKSVRVCACSLAPT